MKNLILISIIIAGLFLQTAAQNYQTVNSGKIASFQYLNDHGFVRIDSVAYEADSILIPFRNIQDIDYDCFVIDGTHWLGDKIIIRDDGMNIIMNKDGDSIYINTASSLNDSWTAFHRPGELSIISTLISHDTMSFLGLQDSVKTIGFQVYDSLMNPVNHSINDFTIRLSKNHGFIRTLNFSVFPDLVPGSFPVQFGYLIEFDISGLSQPVAGIQDFNWMEIFDFQPGDEIHVKWFWKPALEASDYQLLILRYLERTDYPDSVVYQAERIFSRSYYYYGNNTYTFIHDTIPEIIQPNLIFDKLPGEVVVDIYFTYALRMYSGTHIAKISPGPDYWLDYYGDTCWYPIIYDGCMTDYAYYKGLGGPYLSCWFWYAENYRTLVYYKKGNEEWGTPLVIVGMDEAKISGNVKVFPNPAKDLVQFEIRGLSRAFGIDIYELHLFDVFGRQVARKDIASEQTILDVSELPVGVYFYRLALGEVLYSGKLVIQR
ncbi:MAG: T9SS type A sorting domain-containing protein [Bacteroidales bacterium]|nr:T9SS type A sorting domain-containing protein [Bacteroidales bacterium]